MAIGAGREAALEIWRPGHGMIYAWVEFTPLYSAPAIAYSSAPGAPPQPRMQNRTRGKASFRMETEKPGARQMFLKKPNSGPQTLNPIPRVTVPGKVQPTPIPRIPVPGKVLPTPIPRIPVPGKVKPTPMPKWPVRPQTGSNRSAANLFNR